jgi:transposase-like protein
MKNTQARVDRRGRLLRKAEDRQALVAAYRKSGKSQAAFCRERGLNATTFSGWLSKAAKGKAGFVAVEVPMPASEPVEVILPGNVRVLLPVGGSMGATAELIRRIAGCREEVA